MSISCRMPLSEPFQVNLALVQNAQSCFARITGCRPGMAMNTRFDEADPDAFWHALLARTQVQYYKCTIVSIRVVETRV